MKILAINGSHRKGNTQFMLQTILSAYKQKNVESQIQLINLREQNIEYCIDKDYYCTEIQNCTCCRDDMKQIYHKIIQANILIFGTPTYFFTVTARMKTFIQRCNPFWYNKKLKNKPCFLIGVGGSPQKNIQDMLQYLQKFVTKCMGMKIIGNFYARKQGPEDVSKDDKVISSLKQIANELAIN